MFTGVCLSTGGGVLSQHALQVVSQHALQQVLGACYPSMHCRWYPSMACSRSPGGSWPSPKEEVEGDLVQVHSQGVNWGGSGPGPQPRGKLRDIWSGGCLVQGGACSRGCLLWGVPGGDPPPPNGYCCGWYASYWNAFLFMNSLKKTVKKAVKGIWSKDHFSWRQVC